MNRRSSNNPITLFCLCVASKTNYGPKPISASQPMFLWMVCAGTLIMVSSIFPFGIEDDIASYQASSIGCMAGPWLFCIGFVATFSALFSKIWLISRVSSCSRSLE
jgi:hypothetical protein